MVGIWITYSELSSFSKSEKGFVAAFSEAVQRSKQIGINTFFVHTRAFCDAVYPSEKFPFASYIEKSDTDLLYSMVEICHQNDIEFHAWVNPYRISTASNDINTLPDDSPAKRWLIDENPDNDKNICLTDSGIYLNPAESDCKRLVLDGVREIIETYDVDGIHIDDYFYPTTSTSFDKVSYEAYSGSCEQPLALEEWRRKNVNSLINSIYCTVKAKDQNITFGVSPAADLDRNYNTLYADIEGWLGGGYVDYIMPQLYFGFEYPVEQFKFDNLIVKWMDLTANKDAQLYCGLAPYKIGTNTEADRDEWNNYDDIIARQIKLIKENKLDGYAFFSYTSLFSDNELNRRQLENIMR
ncbi:MAG: family 10 glycosylhydrolase [Acutalibacteraceae bacterium]|nr:family 10 glycosylhydrolase [Acutalibacteraceae bacterium]